MKTFHGRNRLLGNNFELAVYWKERGENDEGWKKLKREDMHLKDCETLDEEGNNGSDFSFHCIAVKNGSVQ